MKKNRFLTAVATVALCVSGMAGVVGAANVKDTDWSFSNQNSEGNTDHRTKQDNTNVYVYPKVGQTLKYTVQKSGIDLRTAVSIPCGTKATLRSSAGTGDYVMLKYYNENYNPGKTSGVWSPDSTQYYTVY
ncbi:MAG: hypothetical protein ACI39R_02475 [Lachnospiraceae bacterium]